jgi:hypothetical protein
VDERWQGPWVESKSISWVGKTNPLLCSFVGGKNCHRSKVGGHFCKRIETIEKKLTFKNKKVVETPQVKCDLEANWKC